MSEWKPIETAPKDGTIIELQSDRVPCVASLAMRWDGARWSGVYFGVLGSREIWWDEKNPPTHWRSIK